ncbi:diguanylate cyclase [Peribacillus muralis]|uniref:sensor domain-containing diguanylate cyclase n=1 Tax=Peribacillus muralis TaxID=264697 RepID=UPI001F4E0CC6|nr:diguanylate cyclase [Peribacillus muralis]MCK1991872.1 diguanylate cyclase [Peribacillus muralis]MCK2012430.1 diguanylate cyclase [Peribacillus muralis]
MKNKTAQMLNQLRMLFFQHMQNRQGELHDETLLETFLCDAKILLELKEVTFFKLDEWKRQFYKDTSTGSLHDHIMDTRVQEYIEMMCKEQVDEGVGMIRMQGGGPDFQVVIPLWGNGKVIGLTAFKEQKVSVLSSLTMEEGSIFAIEFTSILKTALSISKISDEERRYKQLFKVTEKFHSSMSRDAVLEEIIATLHTVYPTFNYFLLLSHDHDGHENLPIKELEYNSENVAALQAYVSGNMEFEDQPTENQTILYAPLKGKQGVYGVLQVIAPKPFTFPTQEIEFISLLANTAGSALENAQLYQQSKMLVADLQLINEVSHHLNSNLRLDETMVYMKRQIIKSFHAQQVGFMMIDKDDRRNILRGSSEFFEAEEADLYVSFLIDRLGGDNDSLFIGDLRIHCPNQEMQYLSLMAVPMMEGKEGKGFAVILHPEAYFFSFDMFRLLQSLIQHSSMAMANSMLREEFEKMVITDHLTQLYTRGFLDEKMSRSMEEDVEGTFIMIDIDNFKSINDTYGHQVGDEILIQVSNLLQHNIRDHDVGARWGGEELAIYLPSVTLEAGIRIAERLKDKVRDISNPGVTISLGVSHWEKGRSDSVKEVVKRADEALYSAKNSGKDRVHVHGVLQ